MASKQDLLEAHGYNRRRLVAAFVSGAPQGRDVESVRRGRPVVAGIAVSVLLLGGAALAGLLASPPEEGWQTGHVVIGKQSAARFVSENGVLHPVLNATSARLMLPASTGYRVVVVDDEYLATKPRGAPRGIIGAPDDLPAPAALLQTGWVACLAGDRPTTTVSATAPPAVVGPAPGLLVSSAGATWLLAGGYRFPVPDVQVDKNLRVQLGRGRSEPLAVPGGWLDLHTLGRALTVLVPRKGQPLPAAVTMGGKVSEIGRLVSVQDASGQVSASLVLDDGLVPLTPFAATVYRAQEAELGQARAVLPADIATVPLSPRARTIYPDDWPVATPVLVPGSPCVVLDTYAAPDRPATTRLLVLPPDSAFVRGTGTRSGVSVDAGRGSLVRVSSTGSPSGPVFLVDQSGQKFAITDASEETLARLGYQGVTPRTVPGPWALLFPSGPALNEQAALSSPSSQIAPGP